MSSIDRLLKAIGYPPDEVKSDGGSVVLVVDGREVRVRDRRGRLVLSLSLGNPPDETLQQLATYATGRMLREEATLAWDSSAQELLLWQAVPAQATDELLVRVFEVFCASCDWWSERIAGLVETTAESVIRP